MRKGEGNPTLSAKWALGILAADAWMIGKKRASKRGKRTPIGERVQFLTMMHPDVVADIKQVAIDAHRAAWDVMEQAAREFLKRRHKKRAR
jgi:hypothetical protein